MEKIITLKISENQINKFEKLLDDFNSVVKPESVGERKNIFGNETSRLIKQARIELEEIKKINSDSKKVIWKN